MRKFLEANKDNLPVEEESAVEALIEEMLAKSVGSFLWTYLVLQKLEYTFGERATEEVLDAVSQGTNQLYYQILHQMAASPSKELAKIILRWTVCAIRPLTTVELGEAIRLNIQDTHSRLEKIIGKVCGQLVYVDKQNTVQLIHATARDFLLDEGIDSEFAINQSIGHARMAEICLRYLGPIDTNGLRGGKRPSAVLEHRVLMDYASGYFSEYLTRSPPIDAISSIRDLEQFLKEQCASLDRNFRDYLGKQAPQYAPLDPRIKFNEGWAIDLIRLVAGFGRCLVSDPSSTYTLIPPLCPPESSLYRQFGSTTKGLEVVGLSARTCADRIFCVNFHEDYCTSAASCDTRFAVGRHSGQILLYHTVTLQERDRLYHDEHVNEVHFATFRNLIAASGSTRLTLWDFLSKDKIWSAAIDSEIIRMTFNQDDSLIYTACRNSLFIPWDVDTGIAADSCSWHEADATPSRSSAPTRGFFSEELCLLAIVQVNVLKCLSTIVAFAFNPNVELGLFAAGFRDDGLTDFGVWDLEIKASINADVSFLAASQDGRTLIANDFRRGICVYNFESLRLIYCINSMHVDIISLVLTGDSSRFIDVRRFQYNIWEPSILVRQKLHDDTNSTEGAASDIIPAPSSVAANIADESCMMTAMIGGHHNGEIMFCGKESGAIDAYETRNGSIL